MKNTVKESDLWILNFWLWKCKFPLGIISRYATDGKNDRMLSEDKPYVANKYIFMFNSAHLWILFYTATNKVEKNWKLNFRV